MSAGSGSGSGDKLGVFLLGMLAGMAAISLIYEKPKGSRRYEDYQREKRAARQPTRTALFFKEADTGIVKR